MNPENVIRELAREPFADRRSQPLWRQIHDRLLEAITSDSLPEGTRLPGEDEMATQFGVTRATLRKALDLLQKEGRLVARKGAGIFVRVHAPRYQIHAQQGGHHPEKDTRLGFRITGLSRTRPSSDAARALGLNQDDPVIRLSMVGLIEHTPSYYAVKEFPAHLLPGFERDFSRNRRISDVFRGADIHSHHRAETRVTGDFATPEEADKLAINRGAPLLRLCSHNIDEKGRPIEYSNGCCPMMAVELIFAGPGMPEI